MACVPFLNHVLNLEVLRNKRWVTLFLKECRRGVIYSSFMSSPQCVGLQDAFT